MDTTTYTYLPKLVEHRRADVSFYPSQWKLLTISHAYGERPGRDYNTMASEPEVLCPFQTRVKDVRTNWVISNRRTNLEVRRAKATVASTLISIEFILKSSFCWKAYALTVIAAPVIQSFRLSKTASPLNQYSPSPWSLSRKTGRRRRIRSHSWGCLESF